MTTTTIPSSHTSRYSLTSDESALTRKRRCQETKLVSGITFLDEANPRVLEVVGNQGAGKTEILLTIAVRCAQAGMLVAYLDIDGTLTQHRLQQAFKQVVGVSDHDDMECCSRVFVVRPLHGLQLLQSLHIAVERKCRVILFDSLLSMHWMLSLTEPLSAGLSVIIPSTLYRLRHQHNIIVVAAKPITNKGDANFVSKTWANGVTHRLYVSGGGVPAKFVTVKDGEEMMLETTM